MHDIAEFLSTHDPFSGLDEDALERLVERVEVAFGAALGKERHRRIGHELRALAYPRHPVRGYLQ